MHDQIARCDREIARIMRELQGPMDLGEMQGALLGLHDWTCERDLLLKQNELILFESGSVSRDNQGSAKCAEPSDVGASHRPLTQHTEVAA